MKVFQTTRLIICRLLSAVQILALFSGVSFAAGSKEMFSLNNTDFVVLISFFIFVGVLVYFKVPSIVGTFLDNRSKDIQTEIEKANEILEEAKKILSSIEADHIKNGETIEQMIKNARERAREEEEKAKKHIEDLMKNKLSSAEGQIKSSERKILDEIEEQAIDLSFEKVRVELSKNLSGKEYEEHFDISLLSIQKGLKQVYN